MYFKRTWILALKSNLKNNGVLVAKSERIILVQGNGRKVPESCAEKQIARGRKEGNVLFNDTLNTFYFTVIWRQTYGKGPLR